jgi:hypothetical protein
VVRTLLLGVTVLLSTMVLLTALLKVGALNYFVKTQIESLFAENLNGRIEIGELDIDFFKGATLSGIKVFVQGEKKPALSADTLSLELDYAELLSQEGNRKLHFKRISLSRPLVRLIEIDSGVFNFEKLFKPSEDTLQKAPDARPLQLVFDQVEINHGDFTLQKKTTGQEARDPELIAMLKRRKIIPVNYDSLHIQEIHLLAKANVESRFLSGVLQDLSFTIPASDFKLVKSSGYFFFTERRSEILAFEAETNRSSLTLSVSLSQFNIFKPVTVKDLTSSTLFVRLTTEKFLADDLSKFIPETAFLVGKFKLNLKAKGDFERLQLERCNIQTDSSTVRLAGTVQNVLSPDSLWMDLALEKSVVDLPELSNYVPDLGLKDYTHLGKVELAGTYRGHLRDFSAKMEFSTLASSGHADLKLNLQKNEPVKYAGKFRLKNLDLALLIRNPDLKSNVNMSGEVDGQGVTLETLKGKFIGKIDTSRIAGRSITTSQLDLQVNQKRMVGSFSLSSGKQKALFDGEVDFDQKTYSGQGFLEAVDLSRVLLDDSLETNLALSYYVRGQGFDLKNLNTSFAMTFDSSTVGKFVVPSGTSVSLSVEQTDSGATVNMLSDILDFHGKGNFDLARLRRLGEREYAALVGEIIENNIFKKDNSQAKIGSFIFPAPTPEAKAAADSLLPVLDLTYDIQFKDLTQLFSLLKVGYVNAVGSVQGSLKSTQNAMFITSTAQIDEARYNDLFGMLDFKTTLSYNDTLISNEGSGYRNKLSMTLGVDAGLFKFGKSRFSQTNLIYKYKNREAYLNFRTTNDNAEALVDIDATGRLAEGQYEIDVRNLAFATQDYLWQLSQSARINLGKESIQFEKVLFENNNQKLSIDGLLELSGYGRIALKVIDLELPEIKRFLFNDPEKRFEGTLNLSLDVEGQIDDPKMKLQAVLDNFAFDKMTLGNFSLNGQYAKQRLNFDLSANMDDARYDSLGMANYRFNHIVGKGLVPIDLRLFDVEKRLIENEDIAVYLKSDDISPTVVEFLLPFFETVRGAIPVSATVSGRFPEPKINIEADIKDVQATVSASAVTYTVNGKINVSPDRVAWKNLQIQDPNGGSGVSSGTVRMKLFSVSDIDVSGEFENLRLLDKTDDGSDESYGTVTGSSNDIHFYGRLEEPVLEGSMVVESGDFFMFKTGASRDARLAEANKFIRFTAREDTSVEARLLRDKNLNKAITFFDEEASDEELPTGSAVEQSFLDILAIRNFRVRNNRQVSFSIIFDRYSGEKLLTEINDMNLIISKRRQNYVVRGSLDISSGKYDFSGTGFDIRGGGKLIWSNNDIRGATMKNLYADKLVRITNTETNQVDEVKLSLYVGGTLNDPQVQMGYLLNNISKPYAATGTFGDQTSQIDPNAQLNVLTLLFARQWYLRPGSSTTASSGQAVRNVGISAGAGLISAQLTRLASGIGGVQSIDINIARDAQGSPVGVDLSLALTVPGTGDRLRFITSGTTAKAISAADNRSFYTNAQRLEYRLSDNVVVEAYRSFGLNRNTLSYALGDQISEVWGMSLSYRQDFRTWSELWSRIFGPGKNANSQLGKPVPNVNPFSAKASFK